MKLTEETKQIKTVGRLAGSRKQRDEIHDHTDQIAMVTGRSLKSVRQVIGAIQLRARQQMLEPEAIT